MSTTTIKNFHHSFFGARAGFGRVSHLIAAAALVLSFVPSVAWSQAARNSAVPEGPALTQHSGTVYLTVYGGTAFNLPGATAVVATPAGVVISGAKKTHPIIGGELETAFGKVVSSYADFSFLDEGKAEATSGRNTVSARAFGVAFRGGFRFQVPTKGRVVPYANIDGGFYHESLASSGALLGSSFNQKLGGNLVSLGYGAGLRVYLGRDWGVRPAVGGYALSSARTQGSLNFPAFTLGIFRQAR